MSDLRSVLTSHYEKHGELTPQIVVEEARPEYAPLHDRFEWDDVKAGEEYRLIQAAQLIRSVRIEYSKPGDTERRTVRGWTAVRYSGDATKAGYIPTQEVVNDELAMKILLKQCEREIADLNRKYGHLAEFAELVKKGLLGEVA